MRNGEAGSFPRLSREAREFLEERVAAFEAAWSRGERPSIEGYLPDPDPSGGQLLVELVHADLEFRIEAGEPARVEVYLARFPELASRTAAVSGLIAAELEHRAAREPGPGLEGQLRRFPRHAGAIGVREVSERGEVGETRTGLGAVTPAVAADSRDAHRLATMPEGVSVAEPGHVIGNYMLLGRIGEGGMGAVYLARQTAPIKREVALKVVKPGMDSRQVIARFETERQALALMNHPNIARVFDAGASDSGHPYFVMELVRGVPIDAYCDGRRLSIVERLGLFVDVCLAVQHAHQKGIIHRDLKPSNVMVTEGDGRPVVKVIDFGVAKALRRDLTDATMFTQSPAMIGTPLYMSPEQAEMGSVDVDTRSDVYSLGVLMYRLLTGTTPFGRERLAETGIDGLRRIIREEEPPRPSIRIGTLLAAGEGVDAIGETGDPRRLILQLRRELDWIALKALEKDRTRRYQTAAAFAADVRQYLAGEEVEACPPSLRYRSAKLARRHAGALVAACLVLLAMIAGTAGSVWYAVQAGRAAADASAARREAERATERTQQAREQETLQRRRAERALYVSDVRLAEARIENSQHHRALASLRSHIPEAGEEDLRAWEWYYLSGKARQADRTWQAHDGSAPSVAWSPDGGLIATVGHDSDARVWDAATGELVKCFTDGNTVKYGAAWSLDGSRLAWGSAATEGALRIWDRRTGEVALLAGNGHSIWDVAWSHDGSRIATCGIRVLADVKGGPNDVATVHMWDPGGGPAREVARIWNVTRRISWSRDGRILAVARERGAVFLFDADTFEEIRRFDESSMSCCWSPAENLLTVGTKSGECIVVEPDGDEVHRWKAHLDAILDVRWSPDARHVATASADGSVKVWSAEDWSRHTTFSGHAGHVNAVAWSPDSQRLATVGSGGVANILSPFDGDATQTRLAAADDGGFRDAAFFWVEPDVLRTVRSSDIVDRDASDGTVVSENPLPTQGRWRLMHPDVALLEGADGYSVPFTCVPKCDDGWTRRTSATVPGDWHLRSATSDGRRLAYVDAPRSRVRVVDLVTGEEKECPKTFTYINSSAWAPDGRYVAFCGAGLSTDDGTPMFFSWVHIVDAETAECLRRVRVGDRRVLATAVAWSPDSTTFVGANEEGVCEVFDAATGERRASARVHASSVSSLHWHPSEPRIASGGPDGAVKVWDSRTGEVLLTLDGSLPITCVRWSPDGTTLAARDKSGAIRIWDSSRGRERPAR